MIVIEGCAVATTDADGTEFATGHVAVDGDRIVAVGPGRYPGEGARIDGTGSTPITTCTSGPPAASPSRKTSSGG
jgi:cytosine/adenosine deaminase-related metal-dependent hydrolase